MNEFDVADDLNIKRCLRDERIFWNKNCDETEKNDESTKCDDERTECYDESTKK